MIKDFECSQCDFKCSQNANLQRHIKTIHDKMKDHECYQCDYKCSTKGDLQRHISVCTGKETCSAGEYKIRLVLEEMGIAWTNGSHKLRNPKTGRFLQWDIIIDPGDEPIFIEYDGRQHFTPIAYWGGEKALKETQYRDQLKNDYCREESYLLLRIPYTKYEHIESIVVDFIRTHTDWSG